MMSETTVSTSPPEKPAVKKPYAPPALIPCGAVHEITRVSETPGGFVDGITGPAKLS
jgi:hypothetical protein